MICFFPASGLRGISVIVPTVEAGQRQITAYLHQVLDVYGTQVLDQENAGNAAIDTPAEYERLFHACNGEPAQFLQGAVAD